MSRSNIEKNLACLENRDKDERYMGTSDLCNELQRDVKLDAAMEARVCSAILKRLDDTSNDVQSKAIQCLAILLRKVQRAQVFEISDKLCALILEGKDELRDIYSIGLKTLIMDVPDDSGRGVAVRLVPRLLSGIRQTANCDVTFECLDCLTDVLRRFGFEVINEHESIVSTVLEQLSAPKKLAQKKATTCLSAAALVLSDTLLNKLVDSLLSATDSKTTDIKVIVTAIGQVSRSVGHRMGRHLPTVVPLFLKFLGNPDDESLQNEAHVDLRETALQGFESLVLRCPREIPPHLPDITAAASAFMKYDPNYCGDDDDEEEAGSDEDFDDYDDEGDDEDDDTSWKVRRAAVKVLSVVASRPEQIVQFYAEQGPEMVNRLKEREENVRLDVIECLSTSVSTTRLSQDPTAVDAFTKLLSPIVTICSKHLAAKDDKTKAAVFALLLLLVELLPDGVAAHAPKLFPLLGSNLSNKTASHSLKLDALCFLHSCLVYCPPQHIRDHLDSLLPLVLAAVGEDWYKLIAQALRVVSASIHVLRPCSDDGIFDSENCSDANTLKSHSEAIYVALIPRLEANDIDQEIKECAISAVGSLISRLGDQQLDLNSMLKLLSEKLHNDVTRMPALKAIMMIAESPLTISLESILSSVMSELSEFLRQQSRPLKQATFETLLALVHAYGTNMDIDLLNTVLKETTPLISDADLHLTHLGLKLTCQVLSVNADTASTAAVTILPPALQLSSSPLLQGRALQSLLLFLKSLVKINAPGFGFDDLYRELRARVDGVPVQKQGAANVSHGLCALVCEAGSAGDGATANLVGDLASGDGPAGLIALLTLGELGQFKDLSGVANLQGLILSGFDSTSEETKTAAAFALGSTAVGRMDLFLPPILSALSEDRNHYLLLSALKEVIVLHASMSRDFSSYLAQVLPPLKHHCRSSEEGVRNMVAECLGALVTMHAEVMVAELIALMSDVEDVLMRWTVASALKYAMNGSSQEVLSAHMPRFLELMGDEDLGVKQSGLHMCNAMVHHQPALAAPFIANTILPILCSTLTFKSERVVDLGPFKQRVDDGLPLRKASLTTIATILDTMPERFDIGMFMEPLAGALGDSESDMQILAHHVAIKLSKIEVLKGSLLCCLDVIVDPIKALIDKTQKTLAKKTKDEAVGGTEVERLYDLLRSAVRTVVSLEAAIRNTDDSATSPKFKALHEVVLRDDKLKAMAEAIKLEN